MTNFQQELIEVEPFDREYSIEELLPQPLLENIIQGSAAVLPAQWAIITETGAIHFEFGPWCPSPYSQLTDYVISHHSESEFLITHTGNGAMIYLPIVYELELKGFMVAWDALHAPASLLEHGRAGLHLFGQLIRLKHQTMLTSGLHGMVVKESYAELKEKAEQLSRSEEKYRKLSASLEIEVQKKTQEIRTAHAHLMQQEKMAAIGQLAAGMAHEINNPLGFILSNLTTLKSYTHDLAALIGYYRRLAELCGKSVDNVSSIDNQCEEIRNAEHNLDGNFLLSDLPVLIDESAAGATRIKKIVHDLKAVARPGESQKELINVHESIEAVLTIVQNRIGPKIEIHREFGPVPLICGCVQEISQVWLNLILNGIDALENQGILSIATQATTDHVLVRIRDTGIGIAPEDLSRIFDPFFTTKDVGKGTGLGLHLAYHLIEQHDGRIEVQSQSGEGTTFSVYLPADKG